MTGGGAAATPDAVASTGEIENAEFASARRGYDKAAVRAYLHTVAERMADLEQSVAQSQGESLQLRREVEQARLEARTRQGELAEGRLRRQEATSRLELAEALRKDALARALAAEAGRQYAEDLLAQAGVSPATTSDRPPSRDVDLREPAERAWPSVGAQTDGDPVMEAADTISVILSETDEEVRALLLDRYVQTEAQVRQIEQAADALVETTKAQAERILDGARQDADRITRSARQIAEVWDGVVAEVHEDIARGGSALSNLRTATRPPIQPAVSRIPDGGGEVPSPVETSVRFSTNQSLAAAVALHTSARDDLHLAEFWIQEAEQDAGEAAALTSRTILDEAHRLLTMADELGHPAPDLVELYGELRRRTQRLEE